MTDAVEIRVKGQVQGVGFRPFVWQLARRFRLVGHVLNDGEGVLIHAAGRDISGFLEALRTEAPPLARVDDVSCVPAAPVDGEDFVIARSGRAGAETRVTPDAATCMACQKEIEGQGRRRGYAFTNCTNCGPRFTILERLPYDRAQTTMAPFDMCARCAAEYGDPTDRRFHAQPIACPECGPRLVLEPPGGDALGVAAQRLLGGEIVSIKGLGGFHLACDATSPAAVERLRARKNRPSKPLALMATEEMIERYAQPSAAERALLKDPSAPIVLMPDTTRKLPEAIAPGIDALGWMLPYTPLHHLLLQTVARPLIMTSANVSGAPQVIDNEEAREQLGEVADAILMHDRKIARRLDDSVVRVSGAGPMVLRRARGQVPGTLPLPEGFEDSPDVVAYGAHLKSAICLTKNGQALLSHHLGDLDDAMTWEEFVKADADYAALFDDAPRAVACDLHPGYRSSQQAAGKGLPMVEVQHHQAHLAACLAENGWPRAGGPVVGIILDGLGLGSDGTIWGGELLLGDYAGFERRAWLRPAPLPGGDAAGREPWRNLLARLDQAGMESRADEVLSGKPLDVLRKAVLAGVNAPVSSSAGRLFDAMAAALGLVQDRQSFEGEAAMRLEALAREGQGVAVALPVQDGAIDPAPLFHGSWEDRAAVAARFHASLAQSFADQARALVAVGEAEAVALSGGCFQNALLLEVTVAALGDVPTLLHNKVPAND